MEKIVKVQIKSKSKNYEIIIKNQLLNNISEFLDLNKSYVIITESMIPKTYVETIKNQLKNVYVITFKNGENSKNYESYIDIIRQLKKMNIKKDACLIGLGGGVVTDMTGFVGSTYLRGVDHILIPTTLLAQVDAAIGGKTGINFDGIKNMIGTFYQPQKVLIDPQTLNTLSNRHFNSGIAEVIKYGLIGSKQIINMLEDKSFIKHIDSIIHQSILIKKHYIEIDEFDKNQRHILNFGHTLGHAYESYYQYDKYLHGEAVAIGMLRMIDDSILRSRLLNIYDKFNLPFQDHLEINQLMPYISKDKKGSNHHIDIILLEEIEKPIIKNVSIDSIKDYLYKE
jgi:3-dehydroquinate synthase